MEMLWPALGICAIVCLVFYMLAAHWRRVLQQQGWMVRKLAARVRDLEEMSDPQFRRRLDESAPMPLEQVLTFSFRLGERFWRGTLGLSDKDWEFVRRFGSFVGSVKLERWRSHTVATILEAVPGGQGAQWQKRSLEFYPGDGAEHGVVLWELRLGLPGGAAERPAGIELVLRSDAIELRTNLRDESEVEASGGEPKAPANEEEIAFFTVPLDTAQLAEFRSKPPLGESYETKEHSSANGHAVGIDSWRAFYAGSDERVGFEWQLSVRDLTRRAEWERWKILDPIEMGRG
jgi:hypothetical protein